MKKLLSIMIAVAMLMSIVCCVPAYADVNAVASLADYTMDFEKGSSFLQTISGVGLDAINGTTEEKGRTGSDGFIESTQLVKDPANANNTVMRYWMASAQAGGSSSLKFGASTTSLVGNQPTASGTIPAGGKITYTFRYFLPQDMEANNPEMVVTHTVGSVQATSIKPLPTEAGVWHTATLAYVNTSTTPREIGNACFRLCGNWGTETTTNWVVKDHTGDGYGDRAIYFDDFKVTIEDAPEADKVESLADYKMSFVNGSSIQQTVSGVGFSVNNGTETEKGLTSDTGFRESTQFIKDPEDKYNTVMRYFLNSATAGSASSLKFSSTTVSSVASQPLAGGTVPAGGKLVYTFRYYLPQEMEANNPEFYVLHNNNIYATTGTPLSTEAGVWHTAVLEYRNKGAQAAEITTANLRLCSYPGSSNPGQWTAKGHVGEGYGDRAIYFDDFRVTIMDAPTPDKVSTLDGYTMGFEDGSSILQTISGVGLDAINGTAEEKGRTGSDGLIESTQLIIDPENTHNTVLRYWMASAQAGGSSSLKFGASTTSLVGNQPTASGTIPAGGKITYTFRYFLPQDVEANNPEMVVTHTVGSAQATSIKPLSTEAGVWHTATLAYVNTSATPREIGNACFRLCGSWGTETTTNWVVKDHTGDGYGDRAIYFDDFKVTIEDAPEADKVESLADYKMSFVNGSSIQQTVSGVGFSVNNGTETEKGLTSDAGFRESTQLIKDPEDKYNTVMRYFLNSATAGNASSLKFSSTTASSVASQPLAGGTVPAGGKLVYTFRYYLPQEMEANNPEFYVLHNNNIYATTGTPLSIETGVWHTATLVYENTSTEAKDITTANLRLCSYPGSSNPGQWTAKDHAGEGYGDRAIYFDDFRVTIEGDIVPDVPEVPVITGISLEKIDLTIKVSTDKEITAAKLIFVSYDSNGKMTAVNSDTAVSLSAQGTESYPIPAGFTTAKVLLWTDLTGFVPLADALEY